MNSTRKAYIAAGVAILFALGLIFWQVKFRNAGPVELTAEDMGRDYLTKLVKDYPDSVFAKEAQDDLRALGDGKP